MNFLLTCSADLPDTLIYIVYHDDDNSDDSDNDDDDVDDGDDDDLWQNVRCRRSVMIIPNCLRRGQ